MAIQFDVVIPDRPGELGKLATTLGERGVNIDAISCATGGGKAYAILLIPEAHKTREGLRAAGYTFLERSVLTVQLEDKPGTLGELAKRLGAAGVNITSIVTLNAREGRVQLAIGVDNLEKARRVV